MRALAISALCTLSIVAIHPSGLAQPTPASIEDLLANGTVVPLPPRRPGEQLPWLTDQTAGLPQAVPPQLQAPVQLSPDSAPTPIHTASVAAAPPPQQARAAAPPPLAGQDFASFKAAVDAIRSGDAATADRLQNRISDSVSKSAIEWLILREAPGYAGADRARAFLTRHPGWPGQNRTRKGIEANLFKSPADPNRVIGFFREMPPLTGEGEIAYGRALLRAGQANEGLSQVRRAWATHPFSASQEKAVLSEFSRLLKRQDHLARAQGMLYRDRITAAERLAPFLTGDDMKMVRAWAAVIRRNKNAGGALKAVPRSARRLPGYLFAKIQHTRRAGDAVGAARMMTEAPRDPAALVDSGEWWTERRLLLRMMLNEGRTELAYLMAAGHGSAEAADIAEAEWHAGWVALSYRQRSGDARKHFERMLRNVETPISIARGNYWIGRALAAAGNRGEARRYYARAAEHITTYYGQLAAEEIGSGRIGLGRIAKSDRSVDALEPMRAATLFDKAGRRDLALALTVGMSFYVTEGPDFARLAVTAREMGAPHMAVNIAKRGMRAGVNVADEAYPLSVMPNRGRTKSGTPPAFVYAIARQESEFNRGAVSSAGARGLMQLMPGTARSVSREIGLRYSRSKLTTDPSYNMALGSAYLRKRLGNFDGSYIMAAAAYNAGKSRVDKWIKEFGDPRSRSVDPVEWVERIPFSETRNYVMRVMENMQVYEARLSGNSAALDLKRDLGAG